MHAPIDLGAFVVRGLDRLIDLRSLNPKTAAIQPCLTRLMSSFEPTG
jgi:hypothetical protein